MGLVVQEITKVWSMDSMHFHRPNMVKCKVVFGGQRTPFIGAYLPPSTLDHLPDLEEALF